MVNVWLLFRIAKISLKFQEDSSTTYIMNWFKCLASAILFHFWYTIKWCTFYCSFFLIFVPAALVLLNFLYFWIFFRQNSFILWLTTVRFSSSENMLSVPLVYHRIDSSLRNFFLNTFLFLTSSFVKHFSRCWWISFTKSYHGKYVLMLSWKARLCLLSFQVSLFIEI